MIATAEDFVEGNTVIFLCDEYREGNKSEFDGTIQSITKTGVDVVYLSGFRSRNDFIPYGDILAKVDKRLKWVSLGEHAYSGCFKVFNKGETQ